MNKKRAIFTGVCLIIFLILTYIVSAGQELAFDTAIREWFYSIRTPWLTEVVKAITFMGNTNTIVTLCVLLLVVPLVKGKFGLQITKKVGIPIAATAIIGSAINKTIKHTILRPRPDVSLHLIEQGGWSFPSGHSISGLLMYGLLAWLIRRYVKDKSVANAATVILTMLWIGVGLSRIYLGVHYPTDVLGGWMLGMVIMMVTIMVIERMRISEDRVKIR